MGVKIEITNYKESLQKIKLLKKQAKEVIKQLKLIRKETKELIKEYHSINTMIKVKWDTNNKKGDSNGKETRKKKAKRK